MHSPVVHEVSDI